MDSSSSPFWARLVLAICSADNLQYVKNQLERVPGRFTPIWKWRGVEQGKQCNGLEEGEAGPRELSKLKLAKG